MAMAVPLRKGKEMLEHDYRYHYNGANKIKSQKYPALQTATQRKKRAEKHPIAPTALVFLEVDTVMEEVVQMNFPEKNIMLRQINRYQNKGHPALPRAMAEVEIRPQHKTTFDNNRFLPHDSGAQNCNRFIIFCTNRSLHHLAKVEPSLLMAR
ncbi:hypothetical protein ANN_11217 [Periplaneta americana]|uniref:Uncharacterized protein n=1 Tax=Periplaneta americana TaxID=6978 RepID=A0ABQ8T639_PERAM|nr:hypothetical protein ANN_11217 [Periplaneta americana]